MNVHSECKQSEGKVIGVGPQLEKPDLALQARLALADRGRRCKTRMQVCPTRALIAPHSTTSMADDSRGFCLALFCAPESGRVAGHVARHDPAGL